MEYSVASVQDVQTRNVMSEHMRPGLSGFFVCFPLNNRHLIFQFKRTFKGILELSIGKKQQYKQCAFPGIAMFVLERYMNSHLYLKKCCQPTLY